MAPRSKKISTEPVYFVLTRPTISHYSFSGYTDKDGNPQYIANSRTSDGIIRRSFSFSRKDRTMKIPVYQKDIEGNSVVEFLRNHPECQDSPNGIYKETPDGTVQQNIYFKELNDGKDAKKALEGRRITTKALNLALELDAESAQEVAMLLFGFRSDDIDIIQFKLYEYARNKPEDFLEVADSKDRKARALVRQGVSVGALIKKGRLILWEDTVIGNDEDEAVSNLMKDKKLMDSLNKNVEGLK